MGETSKRKLIVVMTDAEVEKVETTVLSPENHVLDARIAFAEKYGILADDIILRYNDNVLSDHCPLSNFAVARSTIELFVELKITVNFSLYKSTNVPCQTYVVFPSVLPRDLHESVRRLFHLDEAQRFRLWSRTGPLDENLSLKDNGICDSPHVIVDLAYAVNITDSWDGETRALTFFASEKGTVMMNDCIEDERVLFNNAEISMSGDVADALTSVEGNAHGSFALQSSYQKRVFALSDDKTSQYNVWPHEHLNRLKRDCQLGLRFLHESRTVSAENTFSELQVTNDAVIDIDPLEVILTLSSKKSMKVFLSRTACVRDLMMKAVTVFRVPFDQIRLECHGRFIENLVGVRLDQAGVRHNDQVRVIMAVTTVKVHLNGDIWEHQFPQRSVGFSDIILFLCHDEMFDVINTTQESLHCVGCGRKLTIKEEEFQQVPALCCRVQSLELRLVRTTDTGVQGRTFSTEHFQHEDPIRTDSPSGIRLRLRQFNMRDVVYVGSYDDTLENIVTFLRRQNRLMGIKTIHADERELTASANWRKIKLRDCNLEENQLLTVEFITYNHFRVEILSPISQWPDCHLIWLQGREKSLEGIRWHLNNQSSFKIDQSTMIFQLGTFYKDRDGQISRTILSYNQTSNQSEFLDEDTGKVVSYANSSHEFREMLFLGFGFRAAPTRPPVLTFFMESKLFRLGDKSENYEWMEILSTDVRGGKFVMMLEGVLFHGNIFVQCTDNTFFDVVSGEGFADEETLRRIFPVESDIESDTDSPHSLRSFYRIFLFMKSEDKVPSFPVPADKYVGFYLRRGMDVNQEEGILKSTDIPVNSELTWTRTVHVSSFQKKLTRWMRDTR